MLEKTIYIEYLDCYLPETKLNLADCPDHLPDGISAYFCDRKDFLHFSTSVLCVDNIRVERRLDLEKMVMLLLDQYMQRQGAIVRTVKYLIIATDYSYDLKDFGHHILHQLALRSSSAFRVADNYCANIDIAIGLAATLLRSKQEPSRAIIISGAKLGNGLDGRVVGTYGILGDSAGITVLSNEKGSYLAEVSGQVVVTRGELAEMDLAQDNTLLHLQSYSTCLKELLSHSGLLPSMVDQVVIHNANQLLLQQVIKSCGISTRTINKSNLGKFGHLGTCDLVLNLKTILEQDDKAAGNIVSLNLGIIGTYVSTLFRQ
jgi:3-oxoacyl-[acyl-carrier-protein] synthase III